MKKSVSVIFLVIVFAAMSSLAARADGAAALLDFTQTPNPSIVGQQLTFDMDIGPIPYGTATVLVQVRDTSGKVIADNSNHSWRTVTVSEAGGWAKWPYNWSFFLNQVPKDVVISCSINGGDYVVLGDYEIPCTTPPLVVQKIGVSTLDVGKVARCSLSVGPLMAQQYTLLIQLYDASGKVIADNSNSGGYNVVVPDVYWAKWDYTWDVVLTEEISQVKVLINGQEIGQYLTLCQGDKDLGNGWRWLDWFGYFNVNSFPWIYHSTLGWLYPYGTSTDSLWFWDPAMNTFWWTSAAVYPFVYRVSEEAWLYYQVGSSNPRWFYNYKTCKWEKD